MWERLAFYLMLGILVLYATDTERGGLGLPLRQAVEIYGTYLAFVYFTPFLGGMIADRFIGFRRAIFIGGLLMAAGSSCWACAACPRSTRASRCSAWATACSSPTSRPWSATSTSWAIRKRDAGFNIFYMGINIGAAASALLSAPLRNLFSFNLAFIAAGVGLVIGVIILSLNWKKLETADKRSEPDPDDITFGQVMLRIIAPAALCGVLGYCVGKIWPLSSTTIGAITFGFLVGMLPIMGYFLVALAAGPNPRRKPGFGALIPVFVAGGTFFMILHLSGGLMTIYAEHETDREVPALSDRPLNSRSRPCRATSATPPRRVPRPAEQILIEVPTEQEAMFGARRINASRRSTRSPSAAGSRRWRPTIRAWTRLGVPDLPGLRRREPGGRIDGHRRPRGAGDHGQGGSRDRERPLREVVFLTEVNGQTVPALMVSAETYGAVYAQAGSERLEPDKFLGLVNAEMITALFNPVFVVLLTPVVVFFFGRLAMRGIPVSTARKIFIGMLLTTVSLLIMVWSAKVGGNGAIKVSVMWLIIYYLVITFGELCLSPMGLSLVTKLAPKRYVGLMMGGWFLSTSVGNKLSGFISGLAPTARCSSCWRCPRCWSRCSSWCCCQSWIVRSNNTAGSSGGSEG